MANKCTASGSEVNVANSGPRDGLYYDSDLSLAVSARISPQTARSPGHVAPAND
jgi:hypothetical protein